MWAAQQPLDKRVFGVDYDDAELLGAPRRARARRPRSRSASPLHVANGALFGALYANVAPSLPGPGAVRGPLAGLAEHLATWPGTARDRPLRSAAATARSCGATRARSPRRPGATCCSARVLGELERRLNPPRGRAASRSTTAAASPPTATARSSTWSRTGRAERARPHHRRRRASPARHLAALCRGERRRGRRASRAPAGVDLLDAGATRAAVAAARARRRLPPRRARPRRRSRGASPRATLRDNVAMALNVLEAVRAEAPEATVVAVSSGEVYGPPARCRSTRTRRCGRRTPTRSPRRRPTCWPASTPTPTACAWSAPRAFNHAGPGPGADATRSPRSRGRWPAALERGRATRPRRHRQPGHAARLHRRARRRARLPAARRARRAGRLQRLLGPHGVGRASCSRCSPRRRASRSSTRSTRRCVRAHEVMEVRGSPARLQRRDGLGAGDPARADAGRHRRVVAGAAARGFPVDRRLPRELDGRVRPCDPWETHSSGPATARCSAGCAQVWPPVRPLDGARARVVRDLDRAARPADPDLPRALDLHPGGVTRRARQSDHRRERRTRTLSPAPAAAGAAVPPSRRRRSRRGRRRPRRARPRRGSARRPRPRGR